MTGLEVLVGVLVLLNILLIGLLVSVVKDNATLKLLVAQMHTNLGGLNGRIFEQGSYLGKMGATLTELTNLMNNLVDNMNGPMPGAMGAVYRTLDGKYTARSLEELINEIKRDGAETNYLSEDEINNLRKLFEAPEDDDDDDDTFPPNKDKF